METANIEQQLVSFCRALGDENRLKIIFLLVEREMCVCEIIKKLELSQPAVSHHLKILKQAGIVQDKRGGRWIFYSLNIEALDSIKSILNNKLWEPMEKIKEEGIPPSFARKDPSICQDFESIL